MILGTLTLETGDGSADVKPVRRVCGGTVVKATLYIAAADLSGNSIEAGRAGGAVESRGNNSLAGLGTASLSEVKEVKQEERKGAAVQHRD